MRHELPEASEAPAASSMRRESLESARTKYFLCAEQSAHQESITKWRFVGRNR